MPYQYDDRGNLWEIDTQGNAVRMVSAAEPRAIPPNPVRVKQEQGRDSRDQTRTDIAVEGNARDSQRFEHSVSQDTIANAGKLRDDYNQNQSVKNYETAWPSYVAALKTSPDGAGDLQLIYAYAKLMDPNSAVREGETGMVRGGQAWFDATVSSLQGQLDSSGGKFTPEFRERLRSELTNTMVQRNRAYNAQRVRYKADAEAYGIDPQRVIGQHVGGQDMEFLKQYGQQRNIETPVLDIDPGRAYQQDSLQYGRNPGENNLFLAPPKHPEYDWDIARQLDAMLRSGASDDEMNAYAKSKGYGDIGPTGPTRDYLKKHPNHNGMLFNPPLKYTEQSLLGRFNNAAAGTFLRNAMPLSSVADEIGGAANSAMSGLPYAQERDRIDQARNIADQSHPWAANTGALAGGIAGGAMLAKGAPLLAEALAGNALRAGVSGASWGALQGAAQNNNDRLGGAAMGAGIGAVSGAGGYKIGEKILAPLAAAALRTKVAEKALANAPRLAGAVAGYNPPVVEAADKALLKAAGGGQNLNDIATRLSQAGDIGVPYAIADADPRLRALSGMVSRASPEAYATAEQFLEPRSLARNDRAIKAISDNIAAPVDIAARTNDWRTIASARSAPLYEDAFKPNQISWSEKIQRFLDDPISRQALAKNLETQRIESLAAGKPFDPAKFSVTQFDADGNPVLTKTPNLRAVDAIRRGYGEILDAAPKDMHGNPIYSSRDRSVAMAKNAITQELDRVTSAAGNRAYADARQTYGNLMRHGEALNSGFRAGAPNVMARDVEQELAALSPSQLAEYQAGYATKLRDRIAAPRTNVDGFQQLYGGIDAPQKLRVVSPAGAPKIAAQYGFERDMAKTAQEVLGGSQTARRIGLDDIIKPQLAVGLEVAGQMHGVPGAGTLATAGLGKLAKMQLNNAAKKNAERLAPILFSDATGTDMAAYIKSLIAADEAAKRAAKRLGAKAGLLGAMTSSYLGN